MNLFCLFILFSSVSLTEQYNYLVFCPLFGHSHSTFFGRLADILVEAGHEVTFFTPTIITEFRDFNYTKLAKNVIHLDPSPKLKFFGDQIAGNKRWWDREFSIFEVSQSSRFFKGMDNELHVTLSQNLQLLDALKKKKFDLLIFEPIFASAFPMMEYLEIKAFAPAFSITYSSTFALVIGEPAVPSFIPNMMAQSSDRMSLSERFVNTAIQLATDVIFPLVVEYYPSYKTPGNFVYTMDLLPQASFCFMNSNPYLEFPRPMLAKSIQIGGISVDLERLKRGKVNEEWNEVLNLRKKTLLVSFGSVILSSDMQFDKKVAMALAMSKLPDVTFIWKYESDDFEQFAKGVQNIIFSKWIPQRELLADSRLSAFMTHGGLGSVNEVSYLGKPTIMCPIFADQMRNAKMLVRHNGSIEISKYELSDSQKVEETFRKILYDESYTRAAQRLATQLEFQPVNPKELFLKHAEFAAKFGALPSLDPYSRQLSAVQYFLLDLIAIALTFVFIVVLIVICVLKRLQRTLYPKRKTE